MEHYVGLRKEYGEWRWLSNNASIPGKGWRWHSPSSFTMEDHQVTVTVPLCTRTIREEKGILTTYRGNRGET